LRFSSIASGREKRISAEADKRGKGISFLWYNVDRLRNGGRSFGAAERRRRKFSPSMKGEPVPTTEVCNG